MCRCGFLFFTPIKQIMADSSYLQKKLYAFGILLLIISGANVGMIALTGKDYVTSLTGAAFANMIFLAVGVAAVSLAFFRDVYLPFLGPAVMPCSLLNPSVPDGADFEVQVYAEPGTKVMYWAAEPGTKHLQSLPDWRNAYLEFKNAGVAVADDTRMAKLRVRKPQPYMVPMKGKLKPHIHYRVCMNQGFVGPVQTVSLKREEWFENVPEQFTDSGEDDEYIIGDKSVEPFSNPIKKIQGFSNVDESEKPSPASIEAQLENAFAMLGAKKEGFENYVSRQEQRAPSDVDTGFDYVQPSTALAEVNTVAANTLKNSLMPESGGFVESNIKEKGTSMSWAFGPTPFQ